VDVDTLPARHRHVSNGSGGDSEQSNGATWRRGRSRSARRLEKAQEAVIVSLAAASAHMQADVELPTFFNRLCKTLAELTGSRRVAFWRIGPGGVMAVQPEPYGFAAGSPVRSLKFHLASDSGIPERAFFADRPDLNDGTSPELDQVWRTYGLVGIRNSIAVPCRVGTRLIGSLAAYDSRRGFSNDDAWALRVTAIATGLIWQYREAEEELDVTVERLEVALAARRHLLDNIAAGGDEARRRFASALHDDSLQLLTAAELQVERIRQDAAGTGHAAQLDEIRATLKNVEDSLRRLLSNVSPADPAHPVNLTETIRERLESLRIHTGVEPDLDLRLDGHLPAEVELVVFRNIAEALTNVAKHSNATRVRLAVELVDGGVGATVVDNGTGFVVTESLYHSGHLGLIAMRERTQLAGGWCRVESEPGAGARIEFWIPNGERP
jgi:signal transduction histidine kinase